MNDYSNNKKYQDILENGKHLFWKHGFRRVSVEEICKESGVSKMTFYKYFSNKLVLARTILDNVIDESMQKFKAIPKEDCSPAEKMEKILRMKLEGTTDISREFLNDLYNNSNPELGLTQYIEEKTKVVWTEVMNIFRTGQEDGWVRKDLKVEFLFTFMMNSLNMLGDGELLKLYNSPQDLIMEVTNLFVYGISPRT